MAGFSQAPVFHRMTRAVLDWIFPPHCAGCGKQGFVWCSDCQSEVQVIGKKCPKCGLPQAGDELCADCQQEMPIYQEMRSWALYQGSLKKALLGLKYKNNMPVGDALATQAAPTLDAQKWPIDLVIPIPLSRRRLGERGYNQAGLIAHPLALALGLPYAPKALTRWRDTHSQVGLTGKQRCENMRGVFRAEGERLRGRAILVIDDIATTGSTISSATEALLAGGASQVYAFTIARALHWRQDASA